MAPEQRRDTDVLVPPYAWRRSPSRHNHGAPAGRPRLSAPDRGGGRQPRLLRRAAAPAGRSCEDSWVVASMARTTDAAPPCASVAVRPGLQTPAVASRMAATLDQISDGRLLINVVTGGDPVELKGDGVFLDRADRTR